MKHFHILLASAFSAFSAFSAVESFAADLLPVAVPGKGALISSEQIFDLANKPTSECHASTIVETPTGLVTAWFAGTEERDPDVGIRVSRLEDGKWTEPVEVVNGVQSSTLRYPCWNPVLFQPKDGPLLLFYKVGPNPREWWGMLTTSVDGGKTWSTLSATELPNPNSGTDALTLKDGRQVVIYNHTEGGVKQDDGLVLKPRRILNLAVSDDGQKWKPVLTFENETGPHPEDPERRRHFGEYSYPAIIQTGDGLLNIVYTWNREGVKHAVVDPGKL